MDLRKRWPILDELCRCAERFSTMQVWAFGSMLRFDNPRDLDVLVIYNDRADVVAIRDMGFWEVAIPVVDLIAMTPDEERHYRFIETTGALRLHPEAGGVPRVGGTPSRYDRDWAGLIQLGSATTSDLDRLPQYPASPGVCPLEVLLAARADDDR